MSAAGITFAISLLALYVGHHIGDQWAQTHHQALTKGGPSWAARRSCAAHVATLTAVKAATLTITAIVVDLSLSLPFVLVAFAVDALSHYWADRRTTLAALAGAIGKGEYYRLGAPRPGHDDNPSTGTGAYHLDQVWHLLWVWITALIIAGGA